MTAADLAVAGGALAFAAIGILAIHFHHWSLHDETVERLRRIAQETALLAGFVAAAALIGYGIGHLVKRTLT